MSEYRSVVFTFKLVVYLMFYDRYSLYLVQVFLVLIDTLIVVEL